MKCGISILGSTGSIGRQSLDVAEKLGLRVCALTANRNTALAEEQARRFRRAKAARRALGEADYPVDEAFLECLPQIESAAGVALGVDRLVMALTGVREISSVRAEI